MQEKDDFASLFQQSQTTSSGKAKSRLRIGEVASGSVVQIGAEYVFIDVGSRTEARMLRSELVDARGELTLKVGDTVSARVVEMREGEGPRLARSFGQGGMDTAQLEQAKASGIPVDGVVRKVVKGGLEVTVGSIRAFCPASQVERMFVKDLSVYEGQTLRFNVTEIRDGGKSVVLSRRALLESEQQSEQLVVLEKLRPGADVPGTVTSVQKYGAFVDLGGIEGLIHISELAGRRVERVEDVLNVGEKVTVRVLGIDHTESTPKVRLSLKALEAAKPKAETPAVDEVLDGVVTKQLPNGVIVETKKGSGLVPLRELGLPHGSDHRRATPVGKQLKVVLVTHDAVLGRLTFSVAKVAGVEERLNYAEFTKGSAPAAEAGKVGSFGALLRSKLGDRPVLAAEPSATAKSSAAASPAGTAASSAGVIRRGK